MVDQADRLTYRKTARQIVVVVVLVQTERLRRYAVPQVSR